MSSQRRRIPRILAMGLVLVAAGCGGAGTSAGPAATPTRSSPDLSAGASASSTPSATASATGRVAAPPETPVGPTPSPAGHEVSPCAATDLEARPGRSGGAAGHVRFDFVVRNTRGERCTIKGFARVELIGRAGKVLDVRNSHRPSVVIPKVPVRRILLGPGDAASVSVGYADVPRDGQRCPVVRAKKIRLYLPRSAPALTVDAPLSPCRHVVHVSPVVPGAAGATP